MTTWRIIDQTASDRFTVRYTADDGIRSVTMPDMFWDEVTPLDEWLGRVDPWPQPPPADRRLAAPLIGTTGVCKPMNRTPPLTQEDLDDMTRRAPRDPLTVV